MDGMPLVGSDTTDPTLQRVFERVQGAHGRINNLYQILANAPTMLEAWIDFAWTLRADAKSDRALRELMIMRVAQLSEADYEWQAHWPMALESGVTEEKLDGLAEWEQSDRYSAEERLVLMIAEELTVTGALKPRTLADVRGHFGEEQTVELVLTAAFYSCVSRVLLGLGVPMQPTGDQASGDQASADQSPGDQSTGGR